MGKRLEDATVGDHTGTAKTTVYEDHINSLLVETSHHLKNFAVLECEVVVHAQSWSGDYNIGDVIQPVSEGIPSIEIFNVKISTWIATNSVRTGLNP